jgi:predicted nuclease of predicted toxin-antitoxin system
MKIKLDENLPLQIGPELQALGHEVHTLDVEGLSGCMDDELWQAAQREGRLLITQDLDFSDIRAFAPGKHHGLLLIRLRLPSRQALIARLIDIFRRENVSSWMRCFVVVTDRKIRVRRPGSAIHE